MKMKCLFATQLNGDVVKAGQIVDLNGPALERDVVKRYFVAVDAQSAATGASAPAADAQPSAKASVVAGLTREQAIAKLRQAHVKVAGNASNATIKSLFDNTFANIAEAAAR